MESATATNATNENLQLWMGLFFIGVLAGGVYYPPVGYFMLVCMIGAMGIGAIKGRSWCDWMCPRGSFFDVMLKPFSRQREIPKFFKHWAFRLAWMTILMTVLTLRLQPVWGDWYSMAKPFVTLLVITTAVGVLLGIIYHQRIWCMFCPMGTMANILGRGKHPLSIDTSCNGCGECEKTCRMQINPGSYRSYGVVNDADCLKCSHCVQKCQQKALSLGNE